MCCRKAPLCSPVAGGCFWGTQVVYEHVNGVTQVLGGYAGGQKTTVHSDPAGTGSSADAESAGDAESVQVTFDPRQISLGKSRN
jgi:peptide-methionine (S)-S-oxide reductase